MKIETLKEYCDLATSLNFTITAKRFYINHSALSRHISALEEELGCKLLIRTSHFVHLTPEGEAFLPDARRIVKAHDSAIARIRNSASEENRVIRVGYLYESVCDFFLEGCKRFKRDNPSCDLVFYSLNINEISEALVNDDVDLALGVSLGNIDESIYGYRNLFMDEMSVIVPKSNILAKKKMLSVQDLMGRTIIVRALSLDVGPQESSSPLRDFFERTGLADNVVEKASDATALSMTLQMDDSSITIMPTHMLAFFGEGFSMLPVDEMDLSMFLTACWKKENESAVLLDLVSCLKSACGEVRQKYGCTE